MISDEKPFDEGDAISICFFIGHRDAPEWLVQPLRDAVERCIEQRNIANYVVGRYGRFDMLAARAVFDAKERHPDIRLTLLLTYYDPVAPIDLLLGFDDSIYPDGLELVPKRAAIIRANRYMVLHSDYLIAYDKEQIGNTRELVRYAQRCEKRGLIHVENLAQAD